MDTRIPSTLSYAIAAFLLAASTAASRAEARATVLSFEAEEAELSDLTVARSIEGYTGSGYVQGFTSRTGAVTFRVVPPSPGLYQVTLRYATPHGPKKANLSLNGAPQAEIELRETEGFAEAGGGFLLLNEGENLISIDKGWGWYVIDAIHLQAAPAPAPRRVSADPVNKNASAEARALMAFLVDHYGRKTIAGQQEYPANAFVDVNRIKELTGREPALLGLDLMEQSPSRVERGASSDVIAHAVAWHQRGGIIAFTWHWNAPADLIDSEAQRWWSGFYTNATTFDLAQALSDPDSEAYHLLLRDIDAIAAELAVLKEQKIPVLWRPLHEAEGGWFWWGARGPEPCKQLWILMFERMTTHHGLDHLIWVWNSVDPAWYPGDAYADVVSFDSYPGARNYAPASRQFQDLVNLTGHGKLVAMPENGPIPDPDLMGTHHARWSWFCTWNGLIQQQNSLEHLRKVYHHPDVITLDQMPDLAAYQANRDGAGSATAPATPAAADAQE